MKKKQILIICPFYPPNLGGVETHLQHLTDYLLKTKHHVFILTYKPLISKVNYLAVEKNKNLEIHRYWWFGQGWFDKLTPYPIFQFLYIVPGLLINSIIWMVKNNQQVDVIHAHGFAAGFITRIICLLFPKKKIISTHFIYKKLKPGSLYSRFSRWVFIGFDRILLVGKESGKELINIGLDKSKMTLFQHWLDIKTINKEPKSKCRNELGLANGYKLNLIYVGRILRMKGVFKLLKLSKTFPQVNFILVGDGPDYELLKEKSINQKNFHPIGRKKYQQVFKYISASDVLILPSLTEEAQPMVIMESLAVGRPVIITNKGAAKEMIDNSVGFIIEPKSSNIANIIRILLKDKHLLDSLTKNCHPFAIKKFSQKNAQRIIQCYYD